MSIRADWGETVERRSPPVDPFADDPSTGSRLDLRDPQSLMSELLRMEGELADAGTECDLKWNGQSCATCPVRSRDDSPKTKLCGIGLKQEALIGA